MLVDGVAGDQAQYDIAGSQKRFDLIKENLDGVQTLADFYQTLNLVRMGSLTQWQIAYNLNQRQIIFKTKWKKLLQVNLNKINFQCRKNIMGINLRDDSKSFKAIDIQDIKARIKKLNVHPKIKQALTQSTMQDDC